MSELLTDNDIEAMRSFMCEMDDMDKREPEKLPAETWEQLQQGIIPAEYSDRIGKSDKGYYDIAWERWNEECYQIQAKYHDVIIKALRYALSNEQAGADVRPVMELLQALISDAGSITPEQARAALPQLTNIILQKHIIPNNKLANSLTQDIIDAGVINLDVGKKKGDIITRCLLSYEGDNVKLTSRQSFTEYDRNVLDAATSLYEYGDESHVITPATVYRAMVHATETETPSPQQIGAVTRSLDKMRFVRVQIDCSEELTRRKLSLNGAQVTGGKIDTYLLALEKTEVIAGGQKVTAYKIMKTPILYDYSRLTGQVLTVPAALLDIRDETGAKVSNTERRIAIKGYLLRRIERMKGKTGNRQSRHILYADIYASVCEGDPKEKEQRLIREYVALVLTNWKRDKYITGYSELKKGRKKTGVEIKI